MIQANGLSSGDKVQFGILNCHTNGFNDNVGVSFESFRFIPSSATAWSLQEQYLTGDAITETTLGNVSVTTGEWYKFVIALTNTSGASGNYNASCTLFDYGADGLTPGTNMIDFSTVQVHSTGQSIATLTAVWPGLRAFEDAGIDAWDNFLVYTPASLPVITLSLSNTNVLIGNSVTFKTLADGPGAIAYAWFTNSILVAGATNYSYTTPPIGSDFTNVTVVASNGNGATTNSAVITPLTPEPAVVTNVPATAILSASATLNGQVLSTGGSAPAVTFFYGPADGGTNPGAWAYSINAGIQSGAFSMGVTGLADSTTYYFTVMATNATGTSWASPSMAFTTLSPPIAATITNLAATEIENSTAVLNGEVLSNGGDLPNITLYYGTNDGGINAAVWSNSMAIGVQSGSFSAQIAGLSSNTTYFYTAQAVNSAGTSWAVPSMSFTTLASGPPLTSYVNPFIGTSPSPLSHNGLGFDSGDVFPGADCPLGMFQFSPDTPTRIPGGYYYPDTSIIDFSVTHFSGRGITVYQDFGFIPFLGAVTQSPANGNTAYWSGFSHTNETASPGYYRVLLNSGVQVELTATMRSGMAKFTFPNTNAATVLINAGSNINGTTTNTSITIIGTNQVEGYATADISGPELYTIYFVAQFDRGFSNPGTWNGGTVHSATLTSTGSQVGAFVTFDATSNQVVNAKVGISFVSISNAWLNLNTENPSGSFATVQSAASTVWNNVLNKIVISGGTFAQLQTFYTALYHCFFHPNVFNDVNGQYMGMDLQVHTVANGHLQYENISSWDEYRSGIPLRAFLSPDVASDIAQSLVNWAQQGGGAMPRWEQMNRNSGGMIGDAPSIEVADAYVFGATNFDTAGALAAMKYDATNPAATSDGNLARPNLASYISLGYVSDDVSSTLEYCADDFALYQFSQAVGDTDPTDVTYLNRSGNWQNLFNPTNDLIQPRNSDGSWVAAVTAGTTSDYTEGTAIQYTWMVPFNVAGLFNALGGSSNVIPMLNNFYQQFNSGLEGTNEWVGDEPCECDPWEYDYSGAPWGSQNVIEGIQTTCFTNTPSGFPGNDDGGAISSWYVYSALGFFPEIPGVGGFVIVSPMFPSATINLENGKQITIQGNNVSAQNCYVQSLTINGTNSASLWLPFSTLQNGASLVFTLTNTPSSWGTNAIDAPPSFDNIVLPSAPTGLTANAGDDAVSLSWNAVSGAASYNVKRSTSSGGETTITNVSGTNYVDTGLANGTTYYYEVSATNGLGESANSSEVSVKPSGLPFPPTGLSAVAGNAQVSLSWNAVSGAASYNVKRSTISGGETTITNVSGTSYTDTEVVSGTTYYYEVSATNALGESGNSSEVSATPTYLQLWMPFMNNLGNATTKSDTNGGGINITMNMTTNGVGPADLIGAPGTGETNLNVNGQALDLTTNIIWSTANYNNGNTIAEPVANDINDTTLTNLGNNGIIGPFTVSFWMNQKVQYAGGGGSSPRLWILNGGSTAQGENGSAANMALYLNSGLQSSGDQLNFTYGAGSVTLPGVVSANLPTNQWLFVAMTYDGTMFRMYYGTSTNAVVQIGSATLAGQSINLGSTACLSIGNRSTDFHRGFDGLIEDFRFYNGAGDSNFVEGVREVLTIAPTGLSAVAGSGQVSLSWNAVSGAASYNVKRSTISGAETTITNVSGTSYTDTEVVNGTTYYYEVSALNGNVESGNSSEVSATLTYLQLWMPFMNNLGNATTKSDTNGGGINITMNMTTNGVGSADLIGAPGTGETNLNVNGQALDLTTNIIWSTANYNNGNTIAEPVANDINDTTLTNLGNNGIIGPFTVSFWMNQKVQYAGGGGSSPRLWILNGGSTAQGENGSAANMALYLNSGLQSSEQLEFTYGVAAVSLGGDTGANLPTNQWLFVAMTYDGTMFRMYYGTSTNAVVQIGSATLAGQSINLGSTACLSIGNRSTDFHRGFDGLIEDFRFYSGACNSNVVEDIREALVVPTSPRITNISLNGTTLTITATNGSAGQMYYLLMSTNIALPISQWTPVLTNALDGNGSLNLTTNIIHSGDVQEFYILQVQ